MNTELKLTVAEWHLLSIAYHQMVRHGDQDAATQRDREILSEKIKEFTNRVYDANTPLTVTIDG